ncbi:hypothetical protein BB776_00770 [Planococcus salinarum]|uniref:Uncharacterized protein n=1 Tax=Planococcus salinarum TaxID=622695 RepID=A0ABX3D0T4_9BACL|nr:hypothetical protein [Planococcus salinarum]OHX51150.1 hypothetical protein BB776_00770 [Planococcus salinarum]TAA69239.1 hypothetical protein D2909_13085 [Planococcus salinarum]
MIKTPIHLMEEVVFSKKDAGVEDYSICDADWRDQYGLALYILAKRKRWLVVNGKWIPSPITNASPFIRWLDRDRLLLVQRRSRGHEPNVHIANRDGEIVGSFHAGDAIEDVVVGPEGIWISYYYGTLRKGLPAEKLVLFDLKGTPLFKYESDLPTKPDILEVLALVKGEESSIWMVPLTKPLVKIVPETKSIIVHEDPKLLNAGTFAASIRGDFVYFVLEDTQWAYACRIGEELAQPIGKIEGLSRGLGPCESYNFIAYPKTGGVVKLYRIQNKEEYFLA